MAVKQLDYSYLDAGSLRPQYLDPQDSLSMKFHVQGVKCGKCAEKIESLHSAFPDLETLRFNMANHQLHIGLKTKLDSVSKIVQAIEEKGFTLTPIESKNDLEKLNKKEDQKQVLRLGIAAACASNIMMFSFANYFGAAGEMKTLFNWLSFYLYLPILIYAAIPFYQGFWQALKDKRLSVDGPMTIASIGGFLFSSYNLFSGQGSMYFDSLAGFLFLILLSRFIQRQLQKRFLSFHGEMPSESLTRARRLVSGLVAWVPTEILRIGDVIRVQQNEIVPVDGRLVSSHASFSTAYLTGESAALQRRQGASILAGSTLRSADAEIQVSSLAADSFFSKLLRQVIEQDHARGRSSLQTLSDLWSQILLIGVFLIAIIFVAVNWQTNPQMAMERALALIVLACPCAMAFGTPLALAFSMKNAFKKGLLIRSPDVFEKVNQIQNVVFDKTGTLTGKNLRLDKILPFQISMETVNLILSLENISQSSYAEAFRNFFQSSEFKIVEIQGHEEIPGQGVQGIFEDHFYELKTASLTEGGLVGVGLFKDGIVERLFFFEEKINPQVLSLGKSLRDRNLKLHILSGDRDAAVQKIAKELDIPKSSVFSGMSPDQKAKAIQKIPFAMMVGDGVNDSLAFQSAHVGVAVQGSVEMALRSSDIYLLSDDITQINEIFPIAQNAMKLIKGNLWISLAYNLLGGTAALLGFINPFTAALLMPASSGFILLSTWLRSRR